MALSTGHHLIADLYNVDYDILWDVQYLESLLNDLPGKVGMRVLRKAKMVECLLEKNLWETFKVNLGLKETHEDSGVTGMAILYESHVSLHTFPNRNFMYLDLFSCKTFDHDKVIKYVTEYLDTKDYEFRIVERGNRAF